MKLKDKFILHRPEKDLDNEEIKKSWRLVAKEGEKQMKKRKRTCKGNTEGSKLRKKKKREDGVEKGNEEGKKIR